MKNKFILIFSLVLFVLVIIVSLLTGSVDIDLLSLNEITSKIFFGIRLPRVVLGIITGMVLATSGGVLQGMLNNPLAEPYLLGISSGAALGSIIAIILKKVYLMPILGFVGAILTIFLVWQLAKSRKIVERTKLILAGIILNLFFSALIALLMSFFQRELGQIFSVLMGNLNYIFSQFSINILWLISIISLVGVILINLFANRINILSLGDYTADSLGVDVQTTRKILFVLSSLLVGLVVSFTGIIGFVGLIIPHISRMLIGNDNRLLLPLSAILGSTFLVFCDTIARTLFIIELPVGVVTALFGAPFFIYLLKKS
ncbi:MAG: iron ABC transporter permease [Candidatus Cloacimonetes bacterium]|nr:iron ABC transporter permease [Candidatus Cloacimonadota bacterium]MBS3767122.1 iron ABC transporter permease [Candidatus Cloacimonadota bacterium]